MTTFQIKYHNLRPVIVLFFAAGCGGGGESDVSVASSIASSEGRTVYVTMRAVNDIEEVSAPSKEASAKIDSGSEIEVSFNEPNSQLDGECLTVGINHYIVQYGLESGNYTNEITIPRNSTDLACTAVDSDPACGDVTNCTVKISI